MAFRRDRLPRPVRAAIGALTLAAAVRGIDIVWRRSTGGPTPLERRRTDEDEDPGAPAVVRDRLLYALLLGGALRLARRAGLPEEDDGAVTEGA